MKKQIMFVAGFKNNQFPPFELLHHHSMTFSSTVLDRRFFYASLEITNCMRCFFCITPTQDVSDFGSNSLVKDVNCGPVIFFCCFFIFQIKRICPSKHDFSSNLSAVKEFSEALPDYSQLRIPPANEMKVLEDVNTKFYTGTEVL